MANCNLGLSLGIIQMHNHPLRKTLKAAKSLKAISIDVAPTISPRRMSPDTYRDMELHFLQLIHTKVPDFIRIEPFTWICSEEISRIVKSRARSRVAAPLQASSIGYHGTLMAQYIARLRWLWMAWHHSVPRENVLFYWPPQPGVVPCARVIQRLLSEGKCPACLINRKCVFLSASSQLMFHIFQWLWAESFRVLLGEPSVSVLHGQSGHRAFKQTVCMWGCPTMGRKDEGE